MSKERHCRAVLGFLGNRLHLDGTNLGGLSILGVSGGAFNSLPRRLGGSFLSAGLHIVRFDFTSCSKLARLSRSSIGRRVFGHCGSNVAPLGGLRVSGTVCFSSSLGLFFGRGLGSLGLRRRFSELFGCRSGGIRILLRGVHRLLIVRGVPVGCCSGTGRGVASGCCSLLSSRVESSRFRSLFISFGGGLSVLSRVQVTMSGGRVPCGELVSRILF